MINKQRLLPVVEDEEVIGVISRTDLLHLLIAAEEETQWTQPLRTKNIQSLMRERLPKNILAILEQVGQVAEELGFTAYTVGGFVRDLFLRHDNDSKATFREVVEEFCLQESIPFAPRTTGAKTHVDGKQVFLFGSIPIYLDSLGADAGL